MSKKKKNDLDTRNHILFNNYDYTDAGPNETSPGGGLYHGKMDKYKSVGEFLEKRRKERKEKMAKLLEEL